MILPVGHDSGAVRRRPWITLGLLLLNVAALLAFDPDEPGPPGPLERAARYWVDHAYLEADPAVLAEVLHDVPGDQRDGRIRAIRYRGLEEEPLDRSRLAAEQAELDRLTARAAPEIRGPGPRVPRNGYTRFGLVPAAPKPRALLTHLFVHAGWLHLLGNLLLLFLVGPPIEDRWGRPLFALFYATAGVASGAFFVALNEGSTIPLVGASGAIAGVMGAFFVRCWKTRIRCAYLFFLGFRFLRGTFQAPAWLLLPIWFANELLMLWATAGAQAAGGVAYSAHVGGFVFGAGFAALMALSRIEQRLLHPAIEARITARGNATVERALEARERGQIHRAYGLLEREARAHPDDPDAVLAYWDVALACGRAERAAPAVLQLMRASLGGGSPEIAIRCWEDLNERAPEVRADPALLLRLVPALTKADAPDQARCALRQAAESQDPPLTPGLALRVVELARALDPEIALRAAERALADPELPDATRDRIETLVTTLEVVSGATAWTQESAIPDPPEAYEPDAVDLTPAVEVDAPAPAGGGGIASPGSEGRLPDPPSPSEPGAGDGEPASPPAILAFDPETGGVVRQGGEASPGDLGLPPELGGLERARPIKVREAVPVELTDEGLVVRIGSEAPKPIPFATIQALGVGAVRGLSEKPLLLLDLVTRGVGSAGEPLETLRLRSDAFDPRALVPGVPRAAEALRALLARLLEASGAIPLPDAAHAAGAPFPVYPDLEAYEREVLRARC